MDGGWLILNAEKYRNIVTRAVANQQAKERMRKHREKHAVTQQLRSVTPSDHINIKASDQRAIKSLSSEKPQESAGERREGKEALAFLEKHRANKA